MVKSRLLVMLLALFAAGCSQQDVDQFLQLPYDTEFGKSFYGKVEDDGFVIPAANLAVLNPKYRRQTVDYRTSEPAGTIIVDPGARYLYLVTEPGKAIRYGVEVGRDGFGWSGTAIVARKQEWPTWTPPAEMVARDPRTAPYANGMPGGPENPLGARALYLYQNNQDTLYRIHGGGRASTIGRATSSGCIRLLDQDVIDLFSRVPPGTKTVVLPSDQKPAS